MNSQSLDLARAAKVRVEKVYGRYGCVAGVGITRVNLGYGLKINFTEAPELPADLPAEIDGVPGHVEIVGPLRKR